MIYLDSAATSLQKPTSVHRAAVSAMRSAASPGRGGHEPAMHAAEIVFNCREAVARLFNVSEPERVVFTMNATQGLNLAINSLVAPGARVVVSGYEHNAVIRPLHQLGAEIDVAAAPLFEPEESLRAFREKIPGADCVVCNHVSNVFGFVLPVLEISQLCREYGVPLIVDASQSGGALPLDAAALGAEFVAMPGHKGLLGPQGTGVLLCTGERPIRPLLAGGTGSESRSPLMPELLPDRLEAGTHNTCGLAGLLAGVDYVLRRRPEKIAEHERQLMEYMAAELESVPGLRLFTDGGAGCQAGVLSLICEGADCEELGAYLGSRGLAVRAGLHCAPLAHECAGTLGSGTVRLSFSPFNYREELHRAAALIRAAAKSAAAGEKFL